MICGMDKELKELVEGAEKRAGLTSGDRWDVERGVIVSVEPERNYPVDLTRYKNLHFVAHAKQDVPALCAAVRRLDAERDDVERRVLIDVLERLGCGRDVYENGGYDSAYLMTAICGHVDGLKDRAIDLDKQLAKITRAICDYVCEIAGESAVRQYLDDRRSRES